MKLRLLLHDPEEEHDCFADNTHNSHYCDALGMQNVKLGRYKRFEGSVIKRPSVSDLVKAQSREADTDLRNALNAIMSKKATMVKRAETHEAYDQMIGEGNSDGNAVVKAAIDALLVQTKAIQRAVAAINQKAIPFEGSDSLDNPSAVE